MSLRSAELGPIGAVRRIGDDLRAGGGLVGCADIAV